MKFQMIFLEEQLTFQVVRNLIKNEKNIFISAGRSDFDRLENILSELDNSKKIILYVFLTTEYYNKFFTYNLKKIKKKFNVLNNKKKSKHFEDAPFQTVKNLSEDLSSLSEHVKKLKPDLILIAGDRYEMLLGPLVAIPNNIHFSFFGGSITEGNRRIDQHGLTKMVITTILFSKNTRKEFYN